MSAIAANEPTSGDGRVPKDDLYRSRPIAIAIRADEEAGDDPDGARVLSGHFAVTNTWTEINSWYEGRFLERFAPGAFRKTFKERSDQIRILFQHGMDPQVGDKPIADIRELREDDEGAYYEAELLDGVPELVISGLERGLYGASFRFSSLREEWAEEPGESDHNPEGLPERTIKEARVFEGGPVTFGAYPQATAALRSATDNFLILRSADADGRRLLLDRTKTVPDLGTRTQVRAAEAEHTASTPDDGAAPDKPDAAREGTSAESRRADDRPNGGPRTPLNTTYRGKAKAQSPSWRL